MFESLSLIVLQHYWWIIISLLAGVLVFLLFIQGGQTLIYTMGKDETGRALIINSLGRKWEFTFTTLVVFGGAFFASFPLFYSTSFGGAYALWMAILFCFVIQAIAYEYRSKPSNFLGTKTYEWFLFLNGALGTFLLGIAVATFFTGSGFMIRFSNISNDTNVIISQWSSPFHGLEAVTNWRNVLLGLAVFFLSRVLALLYFINNINHKEIIHRARKLLLYNSIPFVLFFVSFVVFILMADGYAYLDEGNLVYLQPYKYLMNVIEMPIAGAMFITGIILVLAGILLGMLTQTLKAIWLTGPGVIVTVFILFLLTGFNNTAFYPSTFDIQSSLTIENASSSRYTLTVMSYVSALIPFVAAYMFWAWRAINNKKLDADELKGDGHVY